MTRQDYYNIITKVFKYDEVTEHGTDYTLNKWHPEKNQIELPYRSTLYLVIHNILEHDSGNFETGEKHYILNKTKLSERLSKLDYKENLPDGFIDEFVPIYREIILNEALS